MAETKVTVLKNGPYLVDGGVPLRDAEGNPVEGGQDAKYALCRCGASASPRLRFPRSLARARRASASSCSSAWLRWRNDSRSSR